MAVLTTLISNVLSLITIGMSLFLKVPQIINLQKVKTARAFSIEGLMLELASYTTMTCYNYVNGYSIMTYMEYPIILIQEWVLIYLVLFYKGLVNQQSLVISGMYFALTAAFLGGVIPSAFLTLLAPLCTPISASSKVIQLMAIVHSSSSHGISLTTWFISAFTNFSKFKIDPFRENKEWSFARAFTVYVDSADIIILSNLGISTILSSLIMAATYYYRPKYIVVAKTTTTNSSDSVKPAVKKEKMADVDKVD